MKNQCFIWLSVLFFHGTMVLGQTYNASVLNRPYFPLVNGELAVNESWDDIAFEVPIGFQFQLFDESITHLYSADFYAGGYVTSNLNFNLTNLIIGMGQDITDRGYEIDSFMSPISFETAGPPGNQIMTLQFQNAGFFGGEVINGIRQDYTNFQIKLYETSGDIEVHIGPYLVTNPGLDFEGLIGPSLGLVESFDFGGGNIYGEILVLAGDPLLPEIITTNSPGFLQWPIPVNTVYRFSRNTVGLHDSNNPEQSLFFFPNPTSGSLNIYPHVANSIKGPITVLNSTGQVVYSEQYSNHLELGHLPAGMYVLQFETSYGVGRQRLLLLGH